MAVERSSMKRVWVAVGGLVGLIAIISLVVAIGQLSQARSASRSQDTAQATVIAVLDALLRIQREMATAQTSNVESGPTATAVAEKLTQLRSTQEALEAERQRLEPTLTAIALDTTQAATQPTDGCVPPGGLIALRESTKPPWSAGIYGSQNMLDFIVSIGEVDTNDSDFGEFQIWLDPCAVASHGYINGGRFWPHQPGVSSTGSRIPLGGERATTVTLPANTGIWGLGPP